MRPLDASLSRPVLLAALAPAIPTDVPADREELLARLEEAGRTFQAWKPGGVTRPGGVRSNLPAFLRFLDPESPIVAAEPVVLPPNARQITRMEQTFGWIERIPLVPGRPGSGELYSRHGGAVLRRIVFLRSLVDPEAYVLDPDKPRYVFSYAKLAERLRCSKEMARQWHHLGLDRILASLHGADPAARQAFPRRRTPRPPVPAAA